MTLNTFAYFTVRYNFSCSSNTISNNASNQYVVVITDRNENTNYSMVMDKLKNLTTARYLKEVLENHIRWKLQIYKAEIFYNSENSSSNNSNLLLFSQLCGSCNNSKDEDQNFYSLIFRNFFIVTLIFCLICIFGNGVTITHELRALIKQKGTRPKERKVHHILVLNLCLADLLMGLSFIIGTITSQLDQKELDSLCNAMGVISSLSTQSSVTILTIITIYRLKSILFPYKVITAKFIAILLVMVWFVWAVVVSLPLFDEVLFDREFTSAITVNRSADKVKIELHKFISSIEMLAQAVNCTSNEPFCLVLESLRYGLKLNNKAAIQLLTSFNLVDFEQEKVDFRTYYDVTGACTF